MPSPDGQHVLVAYGPHSSMWPAFYIGGTRNGIWFIDDRGRVVEDRLTPRLVQGMLFDREKNLWALQNTWGREEPFLLCQPADRGDWFDLRLPPALDNECVQRLLAMDAESGLLYAGRAGNLATDPGRVHVVDPNARTVLRSVEVGRTPTGICVLPERSLVFVSNFDDDTVTLLRGSGEKVKDEPVGSRPIALAADRALETVYVVNHLGASLTVLGKKKKTVPLPEGALPNHLLVDPESGAVFITAHGETEARVYQYDPDSGNVRTLHTFAHPYGEVNFDRSEAAFRLRGQWGDGLLRVTEMALDDSGRLWVADYLGGKLWILCTR
jgi:DNA-binding beta-propeller fold protein YncE